MFGVDNRFVRIPLLVGLAVAALVLAACGGGGDSPGIATDDTGLLRKVQNDMDFEASLKSGLRAVPSADIGAALGGAPPRFSGTYTQEPNVDEFDAVRFDGTHLYIAPLRRYSCCFIGPDPRALPVGPPAPPLESSIRILRADAASMSASPVSTMPLERGVSVQGLYVANGRATALTSEAFYGNYGSFWSQVPYWAPNKLGVRIYDVSNPAAPRSVFSAEINGVFVESRRIGDRLYVVSRYTPSVLLDPQRAAQLDTVPLSELLPRITIGGITRGLVDARECYVTRNDPAGYPVITTLTMIPIANPTQFASTCYNEEASGVYMSESALYLSQPSLAGAASGARSRIHKFTLGAGAPAYAGSIEIAGAIWTGGQSDFRLSEQAGVLRVMTTDFVNDPQDSTEHRLYVLRQAATGRALEIVAELPNSRRPEKIGKPNEQLYGVRFLGDRAYAVTFRRTDPFYVIDLSNASDPRIAGEVDLPGYSDFLHPVTGSLVLGLGEDASQRLKLELFDVSDPTRPSSRSAILLGGRGTSSEARYDRRAFAYLADVSGVDRFAIPTEVRADDDSYRLVESSLSLFEVQRKQSPAVAALVRVGSVIARSAGGEVLPSSRGRAFIQGDSVFYVRDESVWAASWLLPSRVNGPY